MDVRGLRFIFCVVSGIFLVDGYYRIGDWIGHDHLQGMLPSPTMMNITELSTRTVVFCLAECQNTNSCVSAFYNKATTTCYLHDRVRTNTRLMTSDPNSVYYVHNANYSTCFIGDYETQYNTVILQDGRFFTYKMPGIQLIYADAVAYCEGDNANLVHVSTTSLIEWLRAYLDSNYCIDPSRTLVDATNMFAADYFNRSQWISSDNLVQNASFWEDTEPRYPDNENCAIAEKQNYLRSYKCDNDERFICEM